MKIRDFSYTIEPDPLTVGLNHVVYIDIDTNKVLGGWDTMMPFDKIEANKEKLLEKMDDRKQRVLDNIARHEANKQIVLDKLEEKIPIEKLEQFEQMRQRLEERTENFIEKITQNSSIPEDVKERIIENKNRIQERKDIRLETMEQQKELIEKIKEGDTQAIRELKEQRGQLKEQRLKISIYWNQTINRLRKR